MFRSANKKDQSLTPAFKWLHQDIHSHLLPGIDDGSPDVSTSIKLVSALSDAGIKKFICTPHIIGDMYRNTPLTINNALNLLQQACIDAKLDVTLSAAAEYMMDDHFLSLLRSKSPMLTIYKNYILTEFSYAAPPSNLEEMAFEIQTSGYIPILAHPERYFYFHRNKDFYFHLKELGFLLQLNLLSLTGYYGKNAAKAAMFLLKNKLVDFTGTDLHHENHLQVLTAPDSLRLFDKHFSDAYFNSFEELSQ
jgi:tyrosine-protein phosphatase YwqE